MCGIIGCAGTRDAVPAILEGLRRLEYRGYDSAGIAVLDGRAVERRRVKGKIRDLAEELRLHPLAGVCGIGHTRWATHGRPSEDNAHPHTDCGGAIALVHNGIVENYWALKERLKAEGHVFRTETDTEVIVHLVEKHFRGSLEEALRAAVRELEGAFAVACVSSRDPGKIVAARNGPPAVVGFGQGETFLSSDITPLLHHTRRVAYMDDGEMAVLTADGVRFSTFAGAPVAKAVETLDWEPAMVEKRGFAHFMAKEIFEQADVVRDTLKSRVSLDSGRVFLEDTGLQPGVFRRASRVVLIACGTSYHAGLVGKYMLETLARVPVDVEYASELRSRDFVMDRETLVLAISQSGETADTLAALRLAREKALAVLAVTNSPNSSMARAADGLLDLHAGPEIGVAATKTFVGQMAALALFALAFAQARGALSDGQSLELVQELQRVPHKMDRVLGSAAAIERAARRYLACEHYLFLGRWINFPIALEGALKLKEISYTHAEGYAGGEMKHGPIALIDEGMTTLAVVPRDRVHDKMLSNMAEVQARGGRILAVAFEGDDKAGMAAEEVFSIPETHQLFTPFLTVLPLQLFAYHAAAAKGLDVDQPRNLAKSVTVE
ncbi:MAG TPA: glutamine--fructose-6-phosphate transaminase (isomerizing) [Candidatus Aminicenantes bacterium]|nr:glutamine--fructose-6-phosphate transaminase (isomerizing) [Candidatus Aminicenantes bacterium]HRY64089.1 glutamine--fructose-6-phosphate transaminase (isomerizing) [Candidatus Aminicenantes bacterium]HRZ71002.1 glutamine--fructose-6-phosphate transaminase (isomerizing) [Candidatus Aminicenantes bacterium]